MIALIAISTDETQLTKFCGDKVAYPVYLTTQAISKAVCCKLSAHASIVIAYCPADKLECFKKQDRKVAGWHLFHECMCNILKTLHKASEKGVEMTCPDGWIRKIYPILLAYIADYPKQCKVTCAKDSQCPQCMAMHKEMGCVVYSCWHNLELTKEALKAHKAREPPEYFALDGIQACYKPFWEDMLHCNIFKCITLDIMHEIHKGLFFDHLFQWCKELMGKEEMDYCFMAVPPSKQLHLFNQGMM
jgi:hypothetical protein